jgi:hypothetical protein
MSIRVFYRDSNPEVDPRAYRCSNSSAHAAADRGEGELRQLSDGSTILHLFRRAAERESIFTQLTEAQTSSSSAPMGLLRWQPPKTEAWLLTLRTSSIPNVRDFAAVS